MKAIERIKMVKAMEFIMRNLNDESVFEYWLMDGVADGDIEYGSLNIESDDMESLEYYIEDEPFRDLMGVFIRCMARAKKSGGLWCDNVLSKEGNE